MIPMNRRRLLLKMFRTGRVQKRTDLKNMDKLGGILL